MKTEGSNPVANGVDQRIVVSWEIVDELYVPLLKAIPFYHSITF